MDIQQCSEVYVYGRAFASREMCRCPIFYFSERQPCFTSLSGPSIQVVCVSLLFFILHIQSLSKSVICKYLLDSFLPLHSIHTTADPSRALDYFHLSYCNNFLSVSPQGHPLCHCHYAVNLLFAAIPLLNGLLSQQIKLRLVSLEFTAQAEVISPSFCILPPSLLLALLYLCPPIR